MAHYDHEEVREFWQYVWERDGVYAVEDDVEDPCYVLGMFPYTSGTLHMGHVRNYAITDAYARYRRMCGDDVLHPMGWDAFGLPAENAALERYSDPRSWTEACITRMREEMRALGFGYDWSREVTTCDPSYYRWNQWLFTRLYEEGLVEHTGATVNWCPDCETVLADAQVEESRTGRTCWRCDTPVGRRELDQWFFTITDYAEELHEGLAELSEWPEGVREIQRNWIGRQEGAEVTFTVDAESVTVFTTRPDTLGGVTYLALSPGHELAAAAAATDEAVAEYVEAAKTAEPGAVGYDGVETDLEATHPLTGESLPVYVAGYVLDDVGTGAVMGVPAHNERDYEFAGVHDLPVERVLETDGPTTLPDTEEGTVVDGGPCDGCTSAEAAERLVADHEAVAAATTYRLRDWLISRQRYWGTPIPIVHCPDCGPVPVPESDLPVELPEFVHTTRNPLAENESFVETTCPECGGAAERETDTMDTFVDSAWYYLRYLSPGLEDAPFEESVAADWLPVDVYVGGEEHATLHLLYIRFFARALADLGLLETREPVERLVSQGTVLYDGEKMSTSRGNVVDPTEYGAETTRLFVLSAAHPAQDFEWTANDVRGVYDLQQRLYELVVETVESPPTRSERRPHDDYLERAVERTVAAVTDEVERFRFHRAIGEIRRLSRLLGRYRAYEEPHETVFIESLRTLAALLSPFAPHLAEELWNKLRGDGLVVTADWPRATVEGYRLERQFVETVADDVRDIVETAAISDPERIELTVAPAWAYDALEALQDGREDVVDRVLERTDAPRDAVAELVGTLAAEPAGVSSPGDQDREVALLERASWLLVDEFDAAVTVEREPADADTAARPGRPAIDIA